MAGFLEMSPRPARWPIARPWPHTIAVVSVSALICRLVLAGSAMASPAPSRSCSPSRLMTSIPLCVAHSCSESNVCSGPRCPARISTRHIARSADGPWVGEASVVIDALGVVTTRWSAARVGFGMSSPEQMWTTRLPNIVNEVVYRVQV